MFHGGLNYESVNVLSMFLFFIDLRQLHHTREQENCWIAQILSSWPQSWGCVSRVSNIFVFCMSAMSLDPCQDGREAAHNLFKTVKTPFKTFLSTDTKQNAQWRVQFPAAELHSCHCCTVQLYYLEKYILIIRTRSVSAVSQYWITWIRGKRLNVDVPPCRDGMLCVFIRVCECVIFTLTHFAAWSKKKKGKKSQLSWRNAWKRNDAETEMSRVLKWDTRRDDWQEQVMDIKCCDEAKWTLLAL